MKKLICLLIVMGVMMSVFVLGTEEFEPAELELAPAPEEQIETQALPNEETDEDNTVYLNSYDDLYNTMQSMDSNAMYKEEYEKMLQEEIQEYDKTTRDEVIKAKVVKADDPETYFPSSGYSVYKLKYQKITVELLEGPNKGKTYDTEYVLTADSYENLKIEPIKVGQKLNVVFDHKDDGTEVVYATTLDASIVKSPAIITMIIIAFVCVALFLGKYGLRILPQIVLLVDLVILVFVPQVVEGSSTIWLAIISGLAYIVVETAVKVGVNTKMFSTIVASVSVAIVVGIAFHLFNSICSIEGITLEVANIVESYPKGNIDFYALSVSIFVLMLVPIISNISCQTTRVFDENEKDVAKEKIKKYTSGMIPIIVAIFLAVNIQKILYLVMIKYTPVELMNSEILMADFLRMIWLVIAACITPLVAEQTKKLF